MTNNKVGERHVTTEGYTVEIIEYFNSLNCTIKFDDGVVKYKTQYGRIVRGKIKNSHHKSVYGVGYFGIGKYGSLTYPRIYKTWKSMLERCYDKKYQEKRPTYKDCLVAIEWHNFQVFAKWFEDNYKEGFSLDKDILCKDCKIYSPETCCFVPSQINTLITKANFIRGKYPIGVSKSEKKFMATLKLNNKTVYLGTFDTPDEAFQAYKTAKENHIKEVADKWKNKITPQTYQALINWKIEITD